MSRFLITKFRIKKIWVLICSKMKILKIFSPPYFLNLNVRSLIQIQMSDRIIHIEGTEKVENAEL